MRRSLDSLADGGSLQVLVVDDSAAARDEIQHLLSKNRDFDCTCVEAATAEEALRACRDARFDVILLDYHLPDLDAPDVLSALADGHEELPCPVIVLTSVVSRDESVAALRAGAHDFIGKDWMTPGSLWHAFDSAAERFAMQKELRDTRRKLQASEELVRAQFASLEAIYATAPVGLAVSGTDLRYAHMNATLADINGLSVSDHLGRTPEDVLPPTLAREVVGLLRRVIHTGESLVELEMRAETKKVPGLLRDFRVSLTPLRGPDGAVIGVNTVVHEVTAQKAVERELRHQTERLKLAFQISRMGWWEWEVEADWIRWSDEVYPLFGLTSQTFQSTFATFLETIHPDDREWVRARVEAAVERDEPYKDLEFRILRADGSVRWAAVTGTLKRDHAGKRTLIGVDMDVTERKQNEALREELLTAEHAARKEAERLGRLKDEFLATLSHELRTPLNAVLGWCHILRATPANQDLAHKAAEVISRNAGAQAQIVSDLLDMNGIMAGKLRLNARVTSLRGVVRASLDTIEPTASAKGIKVTAAIEDDAPVLGDPDRLQQAFWNLLTNAVKFTPRGGEMSVSLRREDQSVAVTVADTGQGISAEFLPHVFERFRQNDASASRQHGGLGLGLAIVRSIAEMHGGAVHVESDGPGRGARFTLELPVRDAPVTSTNEGIGASTGEVPSPPPLPETMPAELSLAGARLLVVDDEPDAREMLERILVERGATVAAAAGAEEALAVLAEAPVDVLVSDIGMPGVDGYELMRRLRRRHDGQGRLTPAVALTAFARPEDRTRALEIGYQDHVSKPLNPTVLLQAVTNLLPNAKPRNSTG